MKVLLLVFATLLPSLSVAHSAEDGPDPMTMDSLMTAFGWDMDSAQEVFFNPQHGALGWAAL